MEPWRMEDGTFTSKQLVGLAIQCEEFSKKKSEDSYVVEGVNKPDRRPLRLGKTIFCLLPPKPKADHPTRSNP
eukprot:scaffold15665_cov211-Skeletonema_menzelii.AAC.1